MKQALGGKGKVTLFCNCLLGKNSWEAVDFVAKGRVVWIEVLCMCLGGLHSLPLFIDAVL